MRDLDRFRAPPPSEETARRRTAGLSGVQEANLARWGYPFVMEEFRFHITLSGRLKQPALEAAEHALRTALDPILPRPFPVTDIALVGEGDAGRFHLIHRFALRG